MRFVPTGFEGLYVIEVDPARDERGAFGRLWCRDELLRHGVSDGIAQVSLSTTSLRSNLRGMHFQKPPHNEAKWIRCHRGAIHDVVIDLRRASPTFKKSFSYELSADKATLLMVPRGFAHGFLTLTDDVEMTYFISTPYEPGYASGVRWNDPAFGIQWPIPNPIMNEKDARWPNFNEAMAL